MPDKDYFDFDRAHFTVHHFSKIISILTKYILLSNNSARLFWFWPSIFFCPSIRQDLLTYSCALNSRLLFLYHVWLFFATKCNELLTYTQETQGKLPNWWTVPVGRARATWILGRWMPVGSWKNSRSSWLHFRLSMSINIVREAFVTSVTCLRHN